MGVGHVFTCFKPHFWSFEGCWGGVSRGGGEVVISEVGQMSFWGGLGGSWVGFECF